MTDPFETPSRQSQPPRRRRKMRMMPGTLGLLVFGLFLLFEILRKVWQD
jgi:hypothetical protein